MAIKIVDNPGEVNILNREHWLQELGALLSPRIAEIAGKEMPKFRLSVGWPSRGGLAMKRPVIGQCWNGVVSTDGHAELFISPMHSEPVFVAGIVGHELVHTIDENKNGHKGRFVHMIRALGLDGKPTATVPGAEFKKFIDPILKKLGPYPHAAMKVNPGFKVQSTRMLKVECPEEGCKYIVRTTQKQLDRGHPLCPIHIQPMEVSE